MDPRFTLAFVSLLLVPIGGCPSLAPVEVPAKLAAVLDNASQFAQDEADPLGGRSGGPQAA